MAVEGGRASDFARSKKETDFVLDTKQAPGWIVLEDAFDELLSGAGIPDEIALEVGKCHLPVMDAV